MLVQLGVYKMRLSFEGDVTCGTRVGCCVERMKNCRIIQQPEFMQTIIELSPITTNALILGYYVFNYPGPGKLMYWIGAMVLNIGIYIMKG